MAFQLIFGKSAVPGSWQVCERLLPLNTPHDIDVLRQKIRDEVYDDTVSLADQEKIRQLEGDRDAAISSENFYRAYDLCFEIAKLARTFTKENLEIRMDSMKDFANHQDMNFILAYIFFIHYSFTSDKLPDFDVYWGFRQRSRFGNRIEHFISAQQLDLTPVEECIQKFLEIAEDTSLMECLVRTFDLSSVSALISSISDVDPKHFSDLFLSLVDRIELNPTLVHLFKSPIDLPSLPLMERFLLGGLVDFLNSIQRYKDVVSRLWKANWFVKFVRNYAKIFESYSALSFLMATGEGAYFLESLRFLAWPPSTEGSSTNSPFKFINSLPWLWNAAVAPVLFGKKTLDPDVSRLYYPFLILRSKDIDDITDSENLPTMIDLSIFLAAVAHVEWRRRAFLTEIPVDKRTYTTQELVLHGSSLPLKMTFRLEPLNLHLFQHVTIFWYLFWNVKFHAENHAAINNFLVTGFHCYISQALWQLIASAWSPQELGQLMGSTKTFRRMVFEIMSKGLPVCGRSFSRVVRIMGILCTAVPNIFLRELLFSEENHGLQLDVFKWEKTNLAQHQSCAHLIGCMVRGADTALRCRWAAEYHPLMRRIASSYFMLFVKTDSTIEEGINILLAIHGTYRPKPIVSLTEILNEVSRSTKRIPAVKLFISKLLSSKSHHFPSAKSELPQYYFESLKTIGFLVAGIVLASLVVELQGTAQLSNLISKNKQSRLTLICEMKRALELFSA